MTQEKTLGCVLLAAGSARRYGENKLLAALDGRSLILRAMEACLLYTSDAADE